MDLKLIQKLIAMMRRGGIDELELDDSNQGIKVRLKRESSVPPQAPMVQLVHGAAPAPMQALAASAPATAPAAPELQGTPIQSPMVGTFYRQPSPEAEPFVSVGSRITVGQTLCILEAMKVMNEIKAEIAGEITAILVESNEPVEFGQPMFLVKTT